MQKRQLSEGCAQTAGERREALDRLLGSPLLSLLRGPGPERGAPRAATTSAWPHPRFSPRDTSQRGGDVGPQGQVPYGAALTGGSLLPRDLFGGKKTLGLPWLSSASLALNSFKLRTRVYLFPSGPDTLQCSCQPALQLCPQQINVQLRAAMKTSAGGRVGPAGPGLRSLLSFSAPGSLSPPPPDL